jgi:hypothetical protein
LLFFKKIEETIKMLLFLFFALSCVHVSHAHYTKCVVVKSVPDDAGYNKVMYNNGDDLGLAKIKLQFPGMTVYYMTKFNVVFGCTIDLMSHEATADAVFIEHMTAQDASPDGWLVDNILSAFFYSLHYGDQSHSSALLTNAPFYKAAMYNQSVRNLVDGWRLLLLISCVEAAVIGSIICLWFRSHYVVPITENTCMWVATKMAAMRTKPTEKVITVEAGDESDTKESEEKDDKINKIQE